MNRIDFLKYNQFPISTETLNALQDMVFLSARVASLGGSTYILDGCQESQNTVSPGIVVINGEILPFEGGAKSNYVTVIEEKSSVSVYGESYSDIYITRKAVFGSGSPSYPWASFKRLRDLASLAGDINSLAQALNAHFVSHTVQWSNVLGKPAAFTPGVPRCALAISFPFK
jgi:hypothetical protein